MIATITDQTEKRWVSQSVIFTIKEMQTGSHLAMQYHRRKTYSATSQNSTSPQWWPHP